MKGYYIHFDGSKTPGVNKKIKMQTEALQQYFDMEEIEITYIPKSLLWRVLRLLPFGGIERDYESCLAKLKNPDFVYIRRTLADRYYIRFLRKIKKINPECKILIEIYTYPYDKDEFSKWYVLPFYWKEKWNRRKVSDLIDRYVTVSKDDYIFGKQTLKISNGIFVDRVKPAEYTEKENGRIDMIAVAYMQKQHGYERILEGMYLYYKNGGTRPVYLHLVGDGPEKERYRQLAGTYQIDKNVIFYPTMQGDELEAVFQNKDIAVAALGLYKNGVYYESGLKTREYLAKGIPMVTSCIVDVFEKSSFQYYCSFPNDDTPIDMSKIIDFFDDIIQEGRSEVQKKIRQFAKENVDMEKVMKPVIEYLKL